MYKTSLNLHVDLLLKIDAVCRKFNVSKKSLLLMIFQQCLLHQNSVLNETGLTVYQSRDAENIWKCQRIDLSVSQCNELLSCRYRFRISLSRLLAVGFVLFFDSVLLELNQKYKISNENFEKIMNSYTEITINFRHLLENSFKYFDLQKEINRNNTFFPKKNT